MYMTIWLILAITSLLVLHSVHSSINSWIHLRSRLVTCSPPGRTAHRPAIFFPLIQLFLSSQQQSAFKSRFYWFRLGPSWRRRGRMWVFLCYYMCQLGRRVVVMVIYWLRIFHRSIRSHLCPPARNSWTLSWVARSDSFLRRFVLVLRSAVFEVFGDPIRCVETMVDVIKK